jgi:hypothetical protein
MPLAPKIWSFLTGMAASTAVIASGIPNGDFESEERGALAGWLPDDTINYTIPNNTNGTGNGFTDYVWDTASAGGGNGSLLFRGKGIRVPETEKRLSDQINRVSSMKLQVKPDTEYTLTFDYRAQGLHNKGGERCVAGVSLYFASGEFQPGYMSRIGVITDRWSAKENIEGRPTDPATKMSANQSFEIKEDAADWKRVQFKFRTPADATKMDVRPNVYCTLIAHPFAVWYDNFSIEPTATETAAESPKGWAARTLPPKSDRGLHTGEPELLPPAAPYGSGIQRTMKLLATSTPERRHRVRILCYGQSIIAQPWWYKIYGELKRQYPHADLVMENTSLGGFMSDTLRHTAETDLYPVWPDLVLMHDYQPVGAFGHACTEQLYANLKARTTSEMLTYTHHTAFPGLYSNPGMFTAYLRTQGEGSESVRQLAGKYGYEVVEARNNWEKVTKELFPDLDFRFAINHFLYEQIHTHPRGQRFYQYLTMPHFQYRPEDKPTWLESIRVYKPDGQQWPQDKDIYPSGGVTLDKPLKFEFTGSRIDLIAMPVNGKPGSAKVLIDGKPPRTYPSVYTATRATSPAKIGWPLVLRTQIGANPVAEEWTLTFTKSEWEDNDPKKPYYEYSLSGSVTGPDGQGNSKAKFVSRSGRVTLEPEYFLSPKFTGPMKFKPEPGLEVKWRYVPNALDEWRQTPGVDPATEDRYVLAQGLSNERHVLEIIPNGDGPLGLRAMVVHQPSKVDLPPAPVEPLPINAQPSTSPAAGQ